MSSDHPAVFVQPCTRLGGRKFLPSIPSPLKLVRNYEGGLKPSTNEKREGEDHEYHTFLQEQLASWCRMISEAQASPNFFEQSGDVSSWNRDLFCAITPISPLQGLRRLVLPGRNSSTKPNDNCRRFQKC